MSDTLHFTLHQTRREVDKAEQLILESIASHHFDSTSCFAIRLALEEAISNAFKHGNRNDPKKTIRIGCEIASNEVVIEIEDQGHGFDPNTVPDPTDQENLEIPAGRGLMLMRAYLTEVTIRPPGNVVQLRLTRSK